MRARLRTDVSMARGRSPERDYLVVAITFDARPSWPARSTLVLLDDDGFPNAVHSSDTEIVDATVPSDWVVTSSDGTVTIGPPPISSIGDFWELFWGNHEPEDDGRWVQPIYREAVRALVSEFGTDDDRKAFGELPDWEVSPSARLGDIPEH
jgi:hypothetical protein